jgi:hypothetical protein
VRQQEFEEEKEVYNIKMKQELQNFYSAPPFLTPDQQPNQKIQESAKTYLEQAEYHLKWY